MCMETVDIRNISQAIQGLFTVLAIIVGGIWTYFIFIKNRSSHPIINLDLSYDKFEVDGNKRLIHVHLRIENNGLVLLYSKEAELRLRQVTPLPVEVIEDINQGHDPIKENEQEIWWPLEASREWSWAKESFEIEPKESDTLHADFVIDKEIEVVQFYFHLTNSSKTKKQLGWTLTKMINLTTEGNNND